MSEGRANGRRRPAVDSAALGATVALVVLVAAASSVHASSLDDFTLTEEQQNRMTNRVIQHHSFSPPLLVDYYGEGEIDHWVISGSSVVTDNYVRLTPDSQSRYGHIYNEEPLDMNAFEVTIGFHVHSRTSLGADGFGLWITEKLPSSDGPLMGHPAEFSGIGLVFDTYDNDQLRDNPMVSLLVSSGSSRFTPEIDFRGQSLGNCQFDFRNIHSPRMATARLRYNKGQTDVYLSKNAEVDEVLCFSVADVFLATNTKQYFLSLSAATGGLADKHDIIFVHVTALDGVRYDHDINIPYTPISQAATTENAQRAPAAAPEHQQQQQPPVQQQEQQQQHYYQPQQAPPQQEQQQQQQHYQPPPQQEQQQQQQHYQPPPQQEQQQQQQHYQPPPQQHYQLPTQQEQQQQQQHYQPPPQQEQQQQQQHYQPPPQQEQQQQQQHYQPPPQQEQQQQQQHYQPPPQQEQQQQQQHYQPPPQQEQQQQQQYYQPPQQQQQHYQPPQQQQQQQPVDPNAGLSPQEVQMRELEKQLEEMRRKMKEQPQ